MAAKAEQMREERLYKLYLTDSLMAIGQLDTRWADLIKKPLVETRSSEEIIDGIKGKIEVL